MEKLDNMYQLLKKKTKKDDNIEESKIDLKPFNYWPYIYTFFGIVLFTLFAPGLISKLSWGIEFGEQTGPIGDTIGGITAPFLSVAGSILVFAALRAQIQANELVYRQFKKEELEKIEDVKIKLELLVLDLEAILKDIQTRGKSLKEYADKELSAPFEFKVLTRTASKSYSRINSLEREFIYKGFKSFLSKDPEWVKKYHKFYNHLDFIDAFFPNVYSIYDSHVRDQLQLKRDVLKNIDQVMTEAVGGLKDIENKSTPSEISKNPYYNFINTAIVNWYTQLNQDENTLDLELLNKKKLIFDPLIKNGMTIINNEGNDQTLMELIEGIRSINLNINLLEFKGHEMGNNMLDAWKKILEDQEDQECAYTGLKGLKEFIENGMNEALKEA